MMLIFIIIALIALVIGTYTDIKTREVPDWINYGIIFIGLGARLIFSLVNFDFTYIIQGLIGFGIFLAIALIMYYTGQWGGGDSKMLMGLGALFGFELKFDSLIFSFFVNVLFVGALYGLIYSIFLAVYNRKNFFKEWKKIFKKKNILMFQRIFLIISVILLLSLFLIGDIIFKILLLVMILTLLIGFYSFVFIKAVENSCMFKYVKPAELTEGDWIAKDIKVDGKYISGPKDLGIEKKKIRKLIQFYKKGKIKKVLIKVGIPFVPSFLIAFLISLFFGNIIFLFVSI
ncbi:MAG: A24 family peptidase [archaeon]